MRPFVALMLVVVATAADARATCPEQGRWPGEAWPSRAEAVEAEKAQAVAALDAYAFTRTGTEAERQGVRTDAVLVVHAGEIVYERYADGWDADRRHLLWSVSKSITSALTGLAVGRGLDVKRSLCDWLETSRAEHCEITVEHLLWMSSGLHWQEVYEGKSNQASSVLTMLYGTGNRDVPAFVLDHHRRRPPGTYHSYSSGETNVLMAVVEKVMADAGAARDWPWTELFDRIGMKRVTFEEDQAGHRLGSSYVYTPARDLARFGYLYLRDGCWAGEQVLPEGWVTASQTPTEATEYEDPKDVYGYQWWLNRPNKAAEGGRPWPSLPTDAYSARGHWGQTLTVVPSKDLVFVRYADDRDDAFDYDRFASLVLALVP